MSDIYGPNNYEPRKAVGYLLTRVRSEMLAALDRELASDEKCASMEVTSAQFVILANLHTGGMKSATELCKGISYDPGAMTRMIDRLEEKGLLTRRRNPSDRRQVNLELTEMGARALPPMKLAATRVTNRFLRDFSSSESGQLELLLTRMLENALRAG
jgi:MarR family transcriptional regulator, multiple antibiotic resistance protein MarR